MAIVRCENLGSISVNQKNYHFNENWETIVTDPIDLEYFKSNFWFKVIEDEPKAWPKKSKASEKE